MNSEGQVPLTRFRAASSSAEETPLKKLMTSHNSEPIAQSIGLIDTENPQHSSQTLSEADHDQSDVFKTRSPIYSSRREDDDIVNERNPTGLLSSVESSCKYTRSDDFDPWTYENQAIMAPMVRVSTLPARLTARDYGCRMAYSEEIIAKKLIKCTRTVAENGLIMFTEEDKNNSKSNAKALVTYPGERIVLQLGVSNGVDAINAAAIVGEDVRAIDVNMGCPKLFSLQGAMGAALLTEPETVRDIVSSLKRNVNLPITCKIRMLEDPKLTVQLVQMLESMGVAAIGVHARYRDDRPRHRALPLEQMKLLRDSVQVPLLYNGDIFVTEDIDRYRALTGCSSVLIARGASWNYSIFNYHNASPGNISLSHEKSLRPLSQINSIYFDPTVSLPGASHGSINSTKGHSYHWTWPDDVERNINPSKGTQGMSPLYDVAKRYMDYSIDVDNAFQNSKYVLAEMLKLHKGVATLDGFNRIHTSKNLTDLAAAVEDMKYHPALSGVAISENAENEIYRNPHPPNKFQIRPNVGEKEAGKSKKHKIELKILQNKTEKAFISEETNIENDGVVKEDQ